MLFRAPESHPRSIVKAISWRFVGSLDTLILSWLITGKLRYAVSIASVETFTKIFLYYLHERAWGSIPWGRPRVVAEEAAEIAAAPAASSVVASPSAS